MGLAQPSSLVMQRCFVNFPVMNYEWNQSAITASCSGSYELSLPLQYQSKNVSMALGFEFAAGFEMRPLRDFFVVVGSFAQKFDSDLFHIVCLVLCNTQQYGTVQ
jgi:hypothetical protein